MRKLLAVSILLFLCAPGSAHAQDIRGRALYQLEEGRAPRGIRYQDVHLLCAQTNVMQAVIRSELEVTNLATNVEQLMAAFNQVLQGEFNFGDLYQRMYYTLRVGERITEAQWAHFEDAALRTAETVEGGGFVFEDVPPGPYLVVARMESPQMDDAFVYQEVFLGNESEEVDLLLTPDAYSPGESFRLRELRKLVELLEDQAEETEHVTYEQMENAHKVLDEAAANAPMPRALSLLYDCLVR